jgi:hypothetical protein
MGTRPFRGFSPLTAVQPSRVTASSMPFLALRRRSSEDLSLLADAFSDDAVVHGTEGSLLSWSFYPLRG